ncbi:tRNA pseudouridine synthase A [Advenella faeciporci]|uniref:tRNA pseudouridine synthase A n=1 Tax=Advenella faeciporci TaxID=797535 RepID=A0A918JFE7_9BURK|nr:tRNA pseudouridine(38-40) synthase TruA [Advenella faeciporci]GGW77335.1 tRNA pseudouridine synthase A [Advenella faeciporci]
MDIKTELPLKRIALGVAYNGTPYYGWQTQPNGQTVQDKLEAALRQFTTQATSTICAGRTDTGVHALSQVVHIDTQAVRRDESWVRGLNALLPDSISVRWAKEVAPDFNARFSACSRTYVYVLRNERILSPHWVGRAGWDFHPLNLEAMCKAAEHLVGTHDFSSFRSSQCQAASPVRTLELLRIEKQGTFIVFTLKANAFLHHMVRNIIGSLVYVGKGRFPSEWVASLLQEKDRKFAAPTFMSDGLYLAHVDYPEEYGLNSFSQFNPHQPLRSLFQA